MAAKKRNASASKKKTDEMKEMKEMEQAETFWREIILWITIAVSLLLFISNLGIGGVVGGFFSGILFGLFGLFAYVFPVIFLFGMFFYFANKGNRTAITKIVAICMFTVLLCTFMSLVISDNSNVMTPVAAFVDSKKSKIGGGMIGASVAYLLIKWFSIVGAYIIDIIGLIISVVLFTGKSAIKGMQAGGRKVYESAREKSEKYQEYREYREQNQKQELLEEEPEEEEFYEEKKPVKKVSKRKQKADTAITDVPIFNIDTENAKQEEPEKVPLNVHNEEAFWEAEPQMPQIDISFLDQKQNTPPPQDDFIDIFPTIIDPEELFEKEDDSVQTDFMEFPTLEKIRRPSDTLLDEEPVVPPIFPFPEPESDTPAVAVNREYPTISRQKEPKKAEKASAQELKNETQQVARTINDTAPIVDYVFPPVDLLKQASGKRKGDSQTQLRETAIKLQQTLKNFGVNITVTDISCGPAVTRFEIQPEMGVKVSKIVGLADDIKLNLAAEDIRIEAPIPGKAAIGIEVPNKETVMVPFRELVESADFKKAESPISFAVGKDIGGKVKVTDIAKMPHLLIAGATGSGKSVCINTIIMSILYKAHPDDVKLIMIDPKVVELSVYNGIPHLMIPVVTDPKKAAGALNWAVAEMTERYEKFAECHVRDLKGYNEKIEHIQVPEGQEKPQKLPKIVIIVDELADLMMVASNEVEEAICRLAQLARACGIHLIIATQRPSVNVITGLIKANMPSRIAFAVTSGVDSRTILDMVGAEKLLGKGDMLFYPQGIPKPLRVQGAFISDTEVSDIVEFLTANNGGAQYNEHIQQKVDSMEGDSSQTIAISDGDTGGDGRDSYFAEAARIIIDKEKASIGMLQRYLKVGFNRAARIMDQLEEAGIVGPEEGTKPRKVLMTPEEFEELP